MDFQELFVTAMAALIVSCIIMKMVSSVVVSNDQKIDHKDKSVVDESKITNKLVVKSRKSKKRVKFVEQEVVKNVDHVVMHNSNKDGVELMLCEVSGVVDQLSDKGVVENLEKVVVEEKVEDFIKKGGDFKGIEQCGGVVDQFSDKGVVENLEKVVVGKKGENFITKGDDFKGVEQFGGEREVSDDHDEVKEKDLVSGLVVDGEKVFEPSLVDDEVKLGENEVVEVGGELSKGDEKRDKMAMAMDEDSDDDWEGIERSELEEEFVKAVNFVDGGKGKDGGLENLGSELMMQLYGLQKIAMEGPCYEPQPMALKLSARAKWNAWQRLGSTSPEVAMEQYIKLLADHVPEWMHHSKDDHEVGSFETKMAGDPDTIPDSFSNTCKDKRTQEMSHAAEAADCAVGEKDKE